MTGAVVAGLLAGWAIAVPVGAIGASLVSLSATAPWRTAVAAALAPLVSEVTGPLRRVSALVLLCLALRTAVAALRPVDALAPLAARRAFVRLLALTLVNPVTVVSFTALVVGAHGGSSWAEQLVFAVGAFVASASWQLLLVGCGGLLGSALTGRRGRLATGLVSSGVIAVLALDVLRT